MKLKQYVFLLSLLLFCSPFVKAQDFALKSNFLYDATATINIGAEVGLSPRWTLDVSGNFNGISRVAASGAVGHADKIGLQLPERVYRAV